MVNGGGLAVGKGEACHGARWVIRHAVDIARQAAHPIRAIVGVGDDATRWRGQAGHIPLAIVTIRGGVGRPAGCLDLLIEPILCVVRVGEGSSRV